jgi:methylglutaconyl-CoA hydratase
LQVTYEGQAAMVALNRPTVRNAFNPTMIGELTDLFALLSQSEVRVVVLSGNGKSFCAGADVGWMRESLQYSHDENVEDARRMSDMFAAVNSCRKPVVARVHGAALGGGMGLIAVADIVVAAADTVFGFTEAKLGIIPAVISRFVVPKIGESWARALFPGGERFGAEVAQRIGLVHWVVPEMELDATVDLRVSELLTAGPMAAEEAKHLIAATRGESDQSVREMTARRIAALRASPEGQEGLGAFLERRKPSWHP